MFNWFSQWSKSRSKQNEWGIQIANFGSTEDLRYFRGARPDKAGYEGLRDLGIRAIINLTDDGRSKQDAALALSILPGIQYVHIPLSDTKPIPEAMVTAFDNAIALPGPVYLMCVGGRHRTGALWAYMRVRLYGWSPSKAWKENEEHFGYYDRAWFVGPDHSAVRKWFFNRFGK